MLLWCNGSHAWPRPKCRKACEFDSRGEYAMLLAPDWTGTGLLPRAEWVRVLLGAPPGGITTGDWVTDLYQGR